MNNRTSPARLVRERETNPFDFPLPLSISSTVDDNRDKNPEKRRRKEFRWLEVARR